MACAGVVTGDTTASGAVTLSPTAKVSGDMTTAAISIERGALLDGKLSMMK